MSKWLPLTAPPQPARSAVALGQPDIDTSLHQGPVFMAWVTHAQFVLCSSVSSSSALSPTSPTPQAQLQPPVSWACGLSLLLGCLVRIDPLPVPRQGLLRSMAGFI